MVEIVRIDPSEMLAAMERKGGGPRKADEVVSYYRRPDKMLNGRPIGQPGWIIWGDTQSGKRDDYIYRGFTPLHQFGRVDPEATQFKGGPLTKDAELCRLYGNWGPILSRPAGPAQFPLDQIIAYRWYRPELIGSPETHEPMRHVRFPQLKQALQEGLKIQEYLCPDCNAINYLQPVHLARHLRNSHDWDRQDILAWGQAMGIDFRAEFKPRVITTIEYEAEEDFAPEPEKDAVVEDDLLTGVETVVPPTLAEAKAKVQADWPNQCYACSISKKGGCKKHKPRARRKAS